MPKIIKNSKEKAGLSPGSVVFIGNKKMKNTDIRIIDYNEAELIEKNIKSISEIKDFLKKDSVTWININGIHNAEKIKEIGNLMNIHPLVLEDIANTNQRPKFEDYGDYIFIVMKILYFKNGALKVNQMSILFSEKYLITFQEEQETIFDPIIERIKNSKWRIRKLGCDYLAYALLDTTVDNYFNVLTEIGDSTDDLDSEILNNDDVLPKIQNLKKDILHIKKGILPSREVISNFLKNESKFIKDETHIYLKDVLDHAILAIDTTENVKESISNNLDLFYTNTSNKMNEVMKVLTIIATIFIPLTFIAGIYGMNFDYMPELKIQWFYPMLWVFMIIIGIGMFILFKIKKWL